MIGLMAKALGISDLAVAVIATGLLALAIIGGVAYLQHREDAAYDRGKTDGKAEITAAVATATATEAARQRAAYEPVIAEQRRTIDALTAQRDTLNQTLKDNDDAAALDDDRDNCGVGAGSVQRLNSVRGRAAGPQTAR